MNNEYTGGTDREHIANIQRYINLISENDSRVPTIEVDGIFGPLTRAAVTAFQQVYGLNPSGEVDYATWETLFNEYNRLTENNTPPRRIAPSSCLDSPLTEGSTGNCVTMLQMMLNTIADRYVNASRVSSGDYDSSTANAVKDMQRFARLPVTGRTDRPTWNAIAAEYNHIMEKLMG